MNLQGRLASGWLTLQKELKESLCIGLAEGWLGFRQSDPIFEKWVGYGLLAALNNKLRDYKDKIGLDNCLLGFK